MPSNASANLRLKELYHRFPKPEQFFIAYNPDLQVRLLADGFTPALLAARPANPTLALLGELYSPTTPLEWLKIQLGSLNDFTEVHTKLTPEQLRETSRLILAAWPGLTAGEICLFIARFKIGEYGQFYGAIDPMKIMSALYRFAGERVQETERYEREKSRDRKVEKEAKGITYEAYLEVKRRAEAGDNEAQQMLKRPSPE